MYQAYIKPFVQDVSKFIFDLLFPMECFGCGQEGSFLCSMCSGKLTNVDGQMCIACKKPSLGGLTHPGCKTPHLPDGLISIYDYHDPIIAKMIIAGKYNFIPEIYRILGKLVGTALTNHYPLLTTHFSFVPIPLSRSRQRWRGFNQAETLCAALSASLNLPRASVLVRHKSTKTQKDLKKEERIKNMDGAFAVSPLLRGDVSRSETERLPAIRNQNFILVDDVTTTGSTLREAATVLKRNGAAQVWCLTVARD